MKCAWDSLMKLLPPQIRREVDRLGKESLQELRLRIGQPPELIGREGSCWLSGSVTEGDIAYCINQASHYSPWTARTMAQGYLTAEGGHRIGLCGLAVCRDGEALGLRQITSVCIRVARDFPDIARGIDTAGSILILGAPGWGKTTLLRDLIRQRARWDTVAVVDERGELFPQGLTGGRRMDVLTGVSKQAGLLQLLRTMGPGCIALDEITADGDCDAICQAAGCGVDLLATAHAGSLEEFCRRPLYRRLYESGIFQQYVILRRDKSFRTERREA